MEREGVVYTPASIGPRGCVLYRVSVPGGRAPAALVYRSTDGEFSYNRPDRCVAAAPGSAAIGPRGSGDGLAHRDGDGRKNGAWDGFGGPGGGFRLESEGEKNILISVTYRIIYSKEIFLA